MAINYRIYGITFSSSFPFKYKLENSDETPVLEFEYQGIQKDYKISGNEVSHYMSGNSIMRLYQGDSHETLVFPGVAAFECTRSEIRAYTFTPELEYLIEICFIGNVMSYWLERQGFIMLHASSIEIEDKAIVFMGGMNRGKTTAASAFVAAGFPLVTDDILSVTVTEPSVSVASGFPQMKLTPDQLKFFNEKPENFEKIHPHFDKRRIPIGAGIGLYSGKRLPPGPIYLIEHVDRDSNPRSIEVNQAEALLSLLKNSFVAELLDSIDRGKPRLDKLASIVKCTSLRRLQIPLGHDNLPKLIEFVVEDCKKVNP